ncbi:MAG TPA: hypothetical protein VFD27_06205 [Chthoniobacteraceae bacterium]|jgi:hypothetical protein|nr:hypothetical protein [Chthoniobacteraceae bacterium]
MKALGLSGALSRCRGLVLLPLFCSAFSIAVGVPATIDCDVQIRVSGSGAVGGGYWFTFAAEGRLRLALMPDSTVKYAGTFTDNLDNGATFAATANAADPNAPVLRISNRFGKFVFIMGSNFGSSSYSSVSNAVRPERFAGATSTSFFGTDHAYTTENYSFRLDFAVGFPGPKAVGNGLTLTLIRDARNFIVPKDPVTGAKSVLVVPGTPSPKITHLTGPGYFGRYTVGSFSANGLNFTVNYFGRNVTVAGSSPNDGASYSGSALISGQGTAAAIGTFTASKQ